MSSNTVATIGPSAVNTVTEDRIQRWSNSFANGAPEQDLCTFVEVVQRTGLSPEARQIYFIKRAGRWAHQVSIDGFRLIAERTNRYAGSDEPVYTSSGKTVGQGNFAKPRPDKATTTVYKMLGGQRCPFTASALWDEYAVQNNDMWMRMPHTMLAKCAESLALRKAFPAELSGLYTQEEMSQAGVDHEYEAPAHPIRTKAPRPPVTPEEPKVLVSDVRAPSGPDPSYVTERYINRMTEQGDNQVVDTTTGEIIDAEVREIEGDESLTWTAFWAWARPEGYAKRPDIEQAIGKSIDGMSPAQVKTALALATGGDNTAKPTPKAKAKAPAKPKTPEKVAMDRLHAVGEKRSLSHDDLHLLGVGLGYDSLTKVPVDDLNALSAWIEEAPDEEIADELVAGKAVMDAAINEE